MDETRGVGEHYGRAGLRERVLAALAAAGIDLEQLGPDDLAPLEEFHTLGRPATLELAELARVGEGQRVLDIGAGLGGPARLLAGRFGCRVVALDLTPEYCEINALLTDSAGLRDRVEIRQGDALDLPFEDGSFDVVWTQHASMNIADKSRFYAEAHRVLDTGGRFAFFDVVAGENSPIHFPVPWADDASINFLVPPQELAVLLEAVGFRPLAWNDLTGRVADWLRRRSTRPASERPNIDFQILAHDMPTKLANQIRNVEEGRVRLLQAVLVRA
ncbi:MAG TPA: methyltransferase domain-containing protein [Acidimicrobiales bacterium]|nr:methyltransferase domain-containing protein [Acidimicrobiales bacterium]